MTKFKEKKVGDICRFISRGITPDYVNDGLKVINQKCIRNNKVDISLCRDTSINTRISENKFINFGDVLINSTGTGTLGRTAIYKHRLQKITADGHVTIIHVNNDVSSFYIGYYLHFLEPVLENLGQGSTNQMELSPKDIARIKILIPDLATQKRITEILSAYDDLIENNNRRIELLEKAAQEIYKEWFVRFRFPGYEHAKFVNGLPEGWEVKRMNDFCFVTDGTHDTPRPTSEGVPLVTGKSINNGFINFDDAYFISNSDHESIKKRSGLKSGDILFSNIGTVGNTCMVVYDREFSVKNVIIFKPSDETISAYLYYLLISPLSQDVFAAQTNGASQQFVGLTFMRRFKIVVPGKNILDRFASVIIRHIRAKNIIHKQNQNLKQQRDLLLPRLMSGKLEV